MAPERLRVLMAGWPNSPHVVGWAELATRAGHEVHVVGRLAPGWPELELPVPSRRLSAAWPPPLRGFHLSRALRRVAAELEPDLVHAHYLPEYGWMAARENLRPLISSAWGSDVLVAAGVNRPRARLALRSSDLVFVDSAHLGREAGSLAGSDIPVEIVRTGLDLDAFSPGDPIAARNALGLPADGTLVVGIRGLHPIYNPELLLDAFARVHERRPGVRLLLKHPNEAVPKSVRETIARLGLDNDVIVLGSVPHEQLPEVYRAADVVVSIPSTDSSPRSVWESLACGRPVVVSDLPWARDELASGERALLVGLDPEEIAAAIDAVLDDPELAARLGRVGRSLAVAELDPDACAVRVDSLYRSVVEDGA